MPLKVKTWATITPAIIGLVGVLVGAIITTGANYLLAVRQETADAAKTKLARANELKTAARLIANEFVLAHSAAKNLVEQKRLMPEQIECTLDAWQRYKGVVALELPYTDWIAVHVAALAERGPPLV
jgi:xanthosine utilization system XapX-like protein